MECDRQAKRWDRLDAARLMLKPASIAVVGATEDRGKFGGRLCSALVKHGFSGGLYPINPKRAELFGRPAYPDLASLPQTPDLALIVLPPGPAHAAVQACAARGVPAAIVISSGFAEAGREGEAHQAALVQIAEATGPRLLGPNCLGVVNTADRVAACATIVLDRGPMLQGTISMASHSGALMVSALNRAQDEGIGFRYLVSCGNEMDLDLCDFFELFLEDPNTSVVALYIEDIRRPARFRELSRQAAEMGKPVLALKVGRSQAGVQAARSHTAAIAGDDVTIDAVLKADGVVRVDSLETLVATANALSLSPRPRGQKVFIMAGSGGACGILADLAADHRLQLANLGPEATSALGELYTPAALQNPLDVGAMRQGVALFHPDSIERAARIVASDPDVHGLVVGLMSQPAGAESMRRVTAVARACDKPLLVYGGIGSADQEALDVVRGAGVPLVRDAEQCIKVATALMSQAAPLPGRTGFQPSRSVPALPAGDGALTEMESKNVLAAWGLPVPRRALARSQEELAAIASQTAGPVAMKVVSPDIAHKSEVHGVELGVGGDEAMRRAFERIVNNAHLARPEARIEGVLVEEMVGGVEVIVGSKLDPQFGPVVLVGLGGVFVELLCDVAVRPAPVSAEEARQMLEGLRGFPLLDGYRGAEPADVPALAELIASFSALACALADQVVEIDLNPVIVRPMGRGVCVVDALIVRQALGRDGTSGDD